MAQIFENLSNLKPNEIEVRSLDALDWFRRNLRNIKRRPIQLLKEGEFVNRVFIGKMYMFFYDAKTQDTLPYWDRFPLVIVMDNYPDGFLGMNLHYIAPRYRMVLLNALYNLLIEVDTPKERVKLSYQFIMNSSKYRWAKPCIKRYLKSNLDSRVSEVPLEHWDMVSMLPSTQFTTNANKVYSDSRMIF